MFNLTEIKKLSNRNVLQYFDAVDSMQMYSYADLSTDSSELSKCIRCFLGNLPSRSVHSERGINIAILLPVHCPALVPTIVGIQHANCVSCFLDSSDDIRHIKKRLIDFHTNIVLCDLENLNKLQSTDNELNITFKCRLFDTECALVQFNGVAYPAKNAPIPNTGHDHVQSSSKVFFYASTSGSCGDVKFIGVTYKSFMPNINSLRNLYCLTQDDVLFVSSPQTFDPFMVDICLAIHNGASLIMTSHKLRCDATKLLDILFPYMNASNVSVMQMTPSLFMRWASTDIKHRIFSQTSRLRILAFGGEPFPATSVLNKCINWDNEHSLRIFNLYGLTEMSCWSTVYEVTKDDFLCNRRVPIGQPIDKYTSFQMNADGELLLLSRVRKCFQPQLSDEEVCASDFEFILHTGDFVNFENNSYYFESRKNSIIKFYGKKIDMAKIELHAKKIHLVENAVCLFDEKHNLFTLFVKVEGKFENIKTEIQKTLQTIGIRVKIICVAEIPLTAHGKMCKSKLLNVAHTHEKQSQPIELVLQELINETLGTNIQFTDAVTSSDTKKKMPKEEGHSSFLHLGGTSLTAIQIVGEFEQIISKSLSYLLPMLFDEQISIYEILARLANDKSNIETPCVVGAKQEIREIVPRWKIYMKKCIDATPTAIHNENDEAIVCVGSHSKLLYNVSIKSGKCVSTLELPDRIESQVIHMGDVGYFGCYDGCMYSFEIRSGSLKWTFNSGAMIKCRALLINGSLLFGNYNESNNFWCLNAENGSLLWSLKIGSKSIYANPIEIENGSKNVLVCSLNGTIALVNSLAAKVSWSFQAESPVFSTPTVFRSNNHQLQIVILAVNGSMYGLTSDGSPLWTHQIDGNIFSSPQHFENPLDNKCTNLIFGSQNRQLYCHSIDADNNCVEVWKFTTSASIRSNPILVQKENTLYAIIFSSNGLVSTVDSKDGKLISQRKINGEVFSSPVIYDGNLFIGSRNNFLYCIDLNELI